MSLLIAEILGALIAAVVVVVLLPALWIGDFLVRCVERNRPRNGDRA